MKTNKSKKKRHSRIVTDISDNLMETLSLTSLIENMSKSKATAVTILVAAYEESRPAKKPNRPPRRERH